MDSNEQVVSKLRGGGNYLSPPVTTSKYSINYSKAPNQGMVSGIRNYVEHGIMPGHFLTALLSDKLTDTFARADGTNGLIVKEWVQWVWGEMPPSLTGSLEIMAKHVIDIQNKKG